MSATTSETALSVTPKRQLRLWHLFALTLAVAITLAVGTQAHPLLGAVVLCHLLLMFVAWRRLRIAIAFVPLLLLLDIFVLMPVHPVSNTTSMHSTCQNNLRHLSMALQRYHDDHGHFPPAVVADPAGKPLYSWRVLLLPYLERQDLFEAFHLDEPWDSPHNLPLAQLMPREFSCPVHRGASPSSTTDFVAIVGDETLWPSDRQVAVGDVRDGLSVTLAIVEWSDADIIWSEPRDLPMQELSKWWYSVHLAHRGKVSVAWADGHSSILQPSLLDAPGMRSILTRAAGDGMPRNLAPP